MPIRCFILLLLAAFCAYADIHQIHKQKLGTLTCSLCHVPTERGSVMLKPPAVEQCRVCHGATFQMPPNPPRTRAILREFSHAHHIDSKARIDAATGLRADCAFCHKSAAGQVGLPTHIQCATCHAKPGIRPRLSASIATSECLGCHAPGEAPVQNAALANFHSIQFSHSNHRANCTTCHAAVLRSDHIADLPLPLMADCMSCHRPEGCKTCHLDAVTESVRPAFHTESFRVHHEAAASAPDAKCFACHQNVRPSTQARDQCMECHQVMRPISHTARWKDDLHGEYAAIDRTTCSMCHVADYCTRCHNELPRSHQPLPLFKAGGHARLAMLNQRACMTCHTFQNTCAECHARR